MNSLFSVIFVMLVLGGVLVWSGLFPDEWGNRRDPEAEVVTEAHPVGPFPDRISEAEEEAIVSVLPETELPGTVIQTVPFTSQAPGAQWGDPVFQNACEEASMIMAAAWADAGESLPPRGEIEAEIRSVSELAEERFGKKSYDTSAEDTAALYREYFGTGAVSVLRDLTLDDLRNILREGNVVIAPMDGRRLGNPHYTPPGPEYHMLVIIGYDAGTGEFVTNDPGTRHGASYRYAEDVLFGAMADYPTGHHLPRPSMPRKSAIGIGRVPETDRP